MAQKISEAPNDLEQKVEVTHEEIESQDDKNTINNDPMGNQNQNDFSEEFENNLLSSILSFLKVCFYYFNNPTITEYHSTKQDSSLCYVLEEGDFQYTYIEKSTSQQNSSCYLSRPQTNNYTTIYTEKTENYGYIHIESTNPITLCCPDTADLNKKMIISVDGNKNETRIISYDDSAAKYQEKIYSGSNVSIQESELKIDGNPVPLNGGKVEREFSSEAFENYVNTKFKDPQKENLTENSCHKKSPHFA